MKKLFTMLFAGLLVMISLSGCISNADQQSKNLSTAAENFEIQRHIVLINGITDKYILEVVGKCSVEGAESALGPRTLEVICRIGENKYEKHYGGLSDNTTFFAQQLEPVDSSNYHRRIIFKPETLIPDFELQTGKQ
jgi:hypothetical protein